MPNQYPSRAGAAAARMRPWRCSRARPERAAASWQVSGSLDSAVANPERFKESAAKANSNLASA